MKNLWAWSVSKCKHFLGAKGAHSCTVRAISPSPAAPYRTINGNSLLFLAWYKGCTNARCILSRSYGHEVFKNGNPFSVQKAHKAVRAGQYHRPMQRHIGSSMEIRVYSRLFLSRYKGCTNARCILSRSYGHEEFQNVNPFSVQKLHKAVRAGQYLRAMHRRIVPSIEIRLHSRLIQARCKGCTNARCILSRSYGHEVFQNVNPFSGSKGAQGCTGRPISPSNAAPYWAINGNSSIIATLPSSVQRLH